MNLRDSQIRAIKRGQKIKPNFQMFCNMGQELAYQLKPIRTLPECGKNLGMDPRMVHVVSCVALGKIAHALRQWEEELRISNLGLRAPVARRVKVIEGMTQRFEVPIRAIQQEVAA